MQNQLNRTEPDKQTQISLTEFGSPQRRHHERDARREAVRLQDDREQRARDEGPVDGPRDGEMSYVVLLCTTESYCVL